MCWSLSWSSLSEYFSLFGFDFDLELDVDDETATEEDLLDTIGSPPPFTLCFKILSFVSSCVGVFGFFFFWRNERTIKIYEEDEEQQEDEVEDEDEVEENEDEEEENEEDEDE